RRAASPGQLRSWTPVPGRAGEVAPDHLAVSRRQCLALDRLLRSTLPSAAVSRRRRRHLGQASLWRELDAYAVAFAGRLIGQQHLSARRNLSQSGRTIAQRTRAFASTIPFAGPGILGSAGRLRRSPCAALLFGKRAFPFDPRIDEVVIVKILQ